MLSMILKILLIIGYLILILLCTVILVILLILFWPVRYHLNWQNEKDSMQFTVKISWLPGLVKGEYRYPDPGIIRISSFGIILYDSGKSNVRSSSKTASQKTDSTDHTENLKTDVQNNKPSNEKKAAYQGDMMHNDLKFSNEESNDVSKPTGFQRIIYTIKTIYDKIKKIISKIDFYFKLIREDDTQELMNHILKRLIIIVKSIRPRSINGQILFGSGSPDTTGYVMALYGMLSAYLGQNLIITPDFENKILEGKLTIKGHLVVAVAVFEVLKVIFDRRLRVLIKKVKKGGNIHGR